MIGAHELAVSPRHPCSNSASSAGDRIYSTSDPIRNLFDAIALDPQLDRKTTEGHILSPTTTLEGVMVDIWTYRAADRLLRYSVYRWIGITWAAVAAYIVISNLFFASFSLTATFVLVTLALIYTGSVFFLQPWQLLKAIVLSIAVYSTGKMFGVDILALTFVAASAYCLHLGDRFTKEQAAFNLQELSTHPAAN